MDHYRHIIRISAQAQRTPPVLKELISSNLHQDYYLGYASRTPLAVSVLDVQPDDIIRDVVLIESSVHGQSVCLVAVIPPTLVVP